MWDKYPLFLCGENSNTYQNPQTRKQYIEFFKQAYNLLQKGLTFVIVAWGYND